MFYRFYTTHYQLEENSETHGEVEYLKMKRRFSVSGHPFQASLCAKTLFQLLI